MSICIIYWNFKSESPIREAGISKIKAKPLVGVKASPGCADEGVAKLFSTDPTLKHKQTRAVGSRVGTHCYVIVRNNNRLPANAFMHTGP